MSANIHPLADVSPNAKLGERVAIGAFTHIGPQVQIDDGTQIASNVTILGRTHIGSNNRIFSGAVLGEEPQDLSYRGGDTRVVIGDGNVIRECVTVNRATEKEDGLTEIGDACYLMACCHVAHDCKLSNRVVMANGVLLGGHVHIHDDATISGNVGVHHFATIGSYAFVGGLSRVLHDVPPYMLADGSTSRPRCVNTVALKRNDFPKDVIRSLAQAHRLIYRNKVGIDRARESLRDDSHLVPAVNQLLSFIQDQQEGRHGRGREGRRAA